MSTELTKIEYLRSKITSLADHIRAKAGKSGAMTFAELEAAVDGISTGSSGGSTGGGSSDSGSGTATIEGGYTINFYDYDEILIESHSAKCGNHIDSPLSFIPAYWANANGYKNTFPLTVASDSETKVYDLYAMAESIVDRLYSVFGVDKNIYPYVLMSQSPNNTNRMDIYFAESYSQNSNGVICALTNVLVNQDNSNIWVGSDIDMTNIGSVTNRFIEIYSGVTLKGYGSANVYGSLKTDGSGSYTTYANFAPFANTSLTVYRLD